MRRIILLTLVALVTASVLCAQQTYSGDSTTIYKNKEGKVLTATEQAEIMKGRFNMSTEILADGKKVVTLIPEEETQRYLQQQMFDKFRMSLIDHPLPDFKFTDVNKNKLSKKDLAGKLIVMNIWFTTCGPCIKEMPLLNEVVTAYKGKDVVFIAPALDEQPQVKKFLQKYTFDYQVVAGQYGYAEKLKAEVFPTHLVVDKEGIIREVMLGYNPDIKDKLGEAINKLL